MGAMDRATLKVSPGTAARLRGAKIGMSADIDQQLTTSQAIDYLLAWWAVTRNQRHLIVIGRDGVPYAASSAPA